MKRPAPAPAWRLYATLFRAVPRGRLLLCVVLAAAQSAAFWPVAFLLRRVFDEALPHGDRRGLLLAAAGVLAASVAQAGLTLGARAVTLDVVKEVIARLRRDLVDRLLLLPRAFHLRADRGVLHATLVQDTERLDDMSAVLISQFLPATASGIGLVAVLAWLHWPLCLALLALWPVLFLAGRRLRARMRVGARAFHTTFDRYSQATLELLRRLDLTRMQAAEEVEMAHQRARIDDLRRDGGAVAWEATVYSTGHEMMGLLTGLAILLLGGGAVIRGAMTIGALVSFYFVARALNSAQGQLFQLTPRLIAGQEALRALGGLLADDPVAHAPPYLPGKRPPRFAGGIAFCGVDFSYAPPDPLVQGIDLQIRAGETIALVGANGAGKSTLLHLLLGFYRPDAGELRADGQPYATLDLGWLRGRIGVVPQTPLFFLGTVAENLTYGLPAATPAQVRVALERAGAWEFVQALPAGLATPIGDDASRLSGGQRQRLALARALLREPPLLVLDEPTTHLDAAAVDALVGTLHALTPRPAILLVSHDDALVARCAVDRVYELAAGHLRETMPASP